MALIFKNDVLYLHIPKTGGNWLTTIATQSDLVLGEVGHKHATYDHLIPRPNVLSARFGPWRHLSNAPHILCVVRNPLAWYSSWFRYQVKRNWHVWGQNGHLRKWHVCSELNASSAPNFMEFMRNVNANSPGFLTAFYGRYIHGTDATVLRNETLAEDFIAFAEKTGLDIDPAATRAAGRIGESPKIDLHWDPDILRQTVENERGAFRAYGYDEPSVCP
ncbi:MAG: hypothetical protein ACU0GG_07150 [Paracoccaceae bacterium]